MNHSNPLYPYYRPPPLSSSVLLTLTYTQSNRNRNREREHELDEYVILIMDKNRNIIKSIYDDSKDVASLARLITCLRFRDMFTFGDNKILRKILENIQILQYGENNTNYISPLISFIDIRKSRANGYRHRINSLKDYEMQPSSKHLKILADINNNNNNNNISKNILDSISNLCWLLAKNLVTHFNHRTLSMIFNDNDNSDILKLCQINRLHLIFLESATTKIDIGIHNGTNTNEVELQLQKLLLRLVYGDNFDTASSKNNVIYLISNLKSILPIFKKNNKEIIHSKTNIIEDIFQFIKINLDNNAKNFTREQKIDYIFSPNLQRKKKLGDEDQHHIHCDKQYH